LALRQAELKAETVDNTFSDGEGKGLVETLRLKLLSLALGAVEAEALVVVLANTVAEIKAKTLIDKLGDVRTHVLVDTLSNTIAEVEAERLGNILGDLVAKTLLLPLAGGLAAVKTRNLGEWDALWDVQGKALVKTLSDTLANLEPQKLGDMKDVG